MTKINVIHNEDNNLYQYPNQCEPQGAYVELECATGDLSSTYNGEIGNAVPFSVWHNRELRFHISPYLLTNVINNLLDRIAPIAQRVIDGYDENWNGSNWVGTYTDDAIDARDEIEKMCEEEDGIFNAYTWSEWLEHDDVLGMIKKAANLEEFEEQVRPTDEDNVITGNIENAMAYAIEYADTEDKVLSLPPWVWKIEECLQGLKNGWTGDEVDKIVDNATKATEEQ